VQTVVALLRPRHQLNQVPVPVVPPTLYEWSFALASGTYTLSLGFQYPGQGDDPPDAFTDEVTSNEITITVQ
jgi:hypothetical protein